MTESNIRNFAIIAHIDHGKSTLADRLLELTGTIDPNIKHAEQILDTNPIERERGITIKLAPVRMLYKKQKAYILGQTNKSNLSNLTNSFILNLIDTPGHVDFGYEVSRSLAACEGALLIVDATQGVQAQTLANLYQARNQSLTVIPVINKIDLPNARIKETESELTGIGFSKDEIICISAKTGENVASILEAIVERIPPPRGRSDKPLRALVFSSLYDTHRGVIVFVRVVDGSITRSNRFIPELKFFASHSVFAPIEAGYFTPIMKPSSGILAGEVGYIATGLKDIRLAKVGDTITKSNISAQGGSSFGGKSQTSKSKSRKLKAGHFQSANYHSNLTIKQFNNSTIIPLPGYREPKPMVFLRLFPIEAGDLSMSREALEKLRLSDSAFTFQPISSQALGSGFQCGFLGLLHAEVVQERLEREFSLSMFASAPSVEYKIKLKTPALPAGRQNSKLKAKKYEVLDSKTYNLEPFGSARGMPTTLRLRSGQAYNYLTIHSPAEFPDPQVIDSVEEPIMQVSIYAPKKYVGAVIQLGEAVRGEYVGLEYRAEHTQFTYLIPLSEIIVDFFDRIKSVTEGYGSIDYVFSDYKNVDIVKIDILVHGEKVDALSFLALRTKAGEKGREIVERLSQVIPREQFLIPVQAVVGGKVIARADVRSFRKDVTQKLYGGDRTRKDKLLEAQKKGKKRMKAVGSVHIPQDVFFKVLKN